MLKVLFFPESFLRFDWGRTFADIFTQSEKKYIFEDFYKISDSFD